MDGNQRYSWTKKKRSLLVSRTLPRFFRCNTISCCHSVESDAQDLVLYGLDGYGTGRPSEVRP
jgi:hypothetical protein